MATDLQPDVADRDFGKESAMKCSSLDYPTIFGGPHVGLSRQYELEEEENIEESNFTLKFADQDFSQNPMMYRSPHHEFDTRYGVEQKKIGPFGVDPYQREAYSYTKPTFGLPSELGKPDIFPTSQLKPMASSSDVFLSQQPKAPPPAFRRSKSAFDFASPKRRLQKIHSSPSMKREADDWLDDRAMDKAMRIVKKHFPDIMGLQETCVASVIGQHGLKRHASKFLQIVNTKGNHWILLSNIGWDHHHVRVFDSCYRKLNPDTRRCIVSLVPADQNSIKVLMPAYQMQENKSDCGLFAVAAMFALALGKDPSKCYWDSQKMRSFLKWCLQTESCQMFPVSQTRVKQLRQKEYDIDVCQSCCNFPSDNAMLRLCSNCQMGGVNRDESFM
jgi:hypothetical protein